jgi:hypothetical protein
MSRIPGRVEFYENETVHVLDRIKLNDGSLLTQGAVSGAIELSISDHTGEEVDTDELAAATVVFDTLQVDGYWEEDSEGYNFRAEFDSEQFDLIGGRQYRLVYLVPTVSFGPKYVIVDAHVKEVEGVDTFS